MNALHSPGVAGTYYYVMRYVAAPSDNNTHYRNAQIIAIVI